MMGCYIPSLPVKAMKNLAGFNGQPHANYFLLRAVIKPSLALQTLLVKNIKRVQLAIPELVSILKADFGAITSSLLLVKAASAAEFKRIDQRFGDFALESTRFNSLANSGAPFPTVLAEPTPTGQSQPYEHDETESFCKMIRAIFSGTDFRREHNEGLEGNSSVQFLEEKYDTT
ncbi:hypothetical protein G6F46_000304 [Rhizopus delemar]|uniref:Uncharacterized protein n=2 Tax=Rhizopus TaxID=4842 RepID=A0A9P6ZEN2_9FUNG|nr:hypothetical protein G6F36_006330 [Rhizopus arrhizus]KAG1467062.1 hypothetical protein G6F55_000073 [Rhizopus delemar]KAG1505528.1 hypothetical protein G6F54_000247 [Rhizopus delemar]KAG1518883.1 hypothetical protein G6F53_000224 [Rhizopus delemar]KAG1529105.1 hypothetical protein G6F52_000038 [Rhizopus delemar]